MGTHSHIMASKNKHIGLTHSGMESYIADRVKNSEGKFKPIDQTKELIKVTHSHAMAKTGTQSFRETIKPEHFGLVKSFGTASPFSEKKINKGVTPSHAALNFTKNILEFKTHSVTENFGLKMEKGKITYNNPNLIKATHSNGYTWISHPKSEIISKTSSHNAMVHMNAIHGTASNKIKFGLNAGTHSAPNKEKRFYAKANDKTQKLDNQPLLQLISKLSDKKPETMLKTKNVTVNGEVVTSPDHVLKSGDVIRIGVGHYVNNSNQMAIIK